MLRYLIVLFLILVTEFSFGQIVLTQTHSNATIGLDRKAWSGLGNTAPLSDGYAHDFILPARTNPCQQITGIRVDINLTGYTNNNVCPHFETYYNLFYGCTSYAGGATCLPATNLIAEPNYPPNTSPPSFNFGSPLGSPLNSNIVPDFGDNLSIDIIPVSNPGCNPVTNGHISYQYTITVTVTVTDIPPTLPTFTQVPAICSGDTLSPLLTMSNEGVTGSWSPALDNTATTTYIFTPDTGQCATSQTMTIAVNPIVTPTFTQTPAICSGDTLSPLPTTSDEGITGNWSPALDNTTTTTYIFTPDTGQCATSQTITIVVNTTVTPTFTQIPAICSGDALSALPTTSNNSIIGTWSPALDNTTTTTYTFTSDTGQCALTQTMTITVNPIVTPTFTQIPPICNGDTLSPFPITSNEGITGSWSPALDNTTTTTYTFTPDAGQCALTQTMTITVNPIVMPTFSQISAICNGDTLSPLPITSNEGITGSWSPSIDNTSTTTYTFTPDIGQCAVTQTMTITVNPIVTPTFAQIPTICNGDTLSPLPITSNEGITGSWNPALDNTTTTTYTFTPDPGQCAVTQIMTIVVNANQLSVFTQVPPICSGDIINPLPTTSENGVTGSWSPTINNTSTTTYTFTPDPGFCTTTVDMTVVVNDIPDFTLPNEFFLCLSVSGNVAIPLIIDTGLTAQDYNFTWFLNGLSISGANQGSYEPTQAGTYEVIVQNIITLCETQDETTVSALFEPVFEANVISDAFLENQMIEVTTTSPGNFEYSLDNGQWQDSSIFTNVSIGVHEIFVRDIRGCIENNQPIVVIGYPKYFTPNDDGFNDTWNIILSDNPNDVITSSEIYILDRYGKLLKQLDPSGDGWNGLFNGLKMPTNDYWFTINYTEPNSGMRKQFRAHFTLKR